MSIGVDRHSNPVWDLNFAVADARLLSETISRALRATGRFSEVYAHRLLAGADNLGSDAHADKAGIRNALLALGQTSDPSRRPSPDDVVIITFSGHGLRGTSGEFYLVPSDLGAAPGEAERAAFVEQAVSSSELSVWLRTIDAAELVFILDACHSAASVQSADFKPGPMGSRGLGQLAFDKGMRVLAASQAEGVAIESGRLRQGLLTYALVQEGLEKWLADRRPPDGIIRVDEWLAYGAERVPQLFDDPLIKRSRGEIVGEDPQLTVAMQRPVLFDFSRRSEAIELQRRGQ
jgi:uncharacterized caspase-like protein